MGKFNLASLDIAEGRRWLETLLLHENSLDVYQRSLLMDALRSPNMLGEGSIWVHDKPMPLTDFLPVLLENIPHGLARELGRMNLQARRFATVADKYIGFEPRIRHPWDKVLLREPNSLVRFALSKLEAKQSRARLFRMNDDLLPSLRKFMMEAAKTSGSADARMEAARPIRGTSHRVGVLSERLGFLLMADGGGTVRMWDEKLRGELADAFGGYTLDVTPVEMNYSEVDDRFTISFLRTDPAVVPFETHATEVALTTHGSKLMDRVELLMGTEPRPEDEPLIFEYNGAARPAWPETAGQIYRAEAKYRGGGDPNGTLAVMAALATTMRTTEAGGLYLLGDRAIYDLADMDGDALAMLGAEIALNHRIDILGHGEDARQIVAGAWDALEGHNDRKGGGGTSNSGGSASGGAGSGGANSVEGEDLGSASAPFGEAMRYDGGENAVDAGFGIGSPAIVCSAFSVCQLPEMYSLGLSMSAMTPKLG